MLSGLPWFSLGSNLISMPPSAVGSKVMFSGKLLSKRMKCVHVLEMMVSVQNAHECMKLESI